MEIAIKDITQENLDDIPELCKSCLYWEFPEDFRDPSLLDPRKKLEFEARKKEWFIQTLRNFENCGKIVYHNNIPVGYAQYAPSARLPQARNYRSGPVGRVEEGVVFLSCLYISDEALRGKGVGVKLLDDMITDLKKKGFKAIETFARRGSSNNPSGPFELYLKRGFYIKDETNLEFPLVRLNLR